jgi:hypothetical protein
VCVDPLDDLADVEAGFGVDLQYWTDPDRFGELFEELQRRNHYWVHTVTAAVVQPALEPISTHLDGASTEDLAWSGVQGTKTGRGRWVEVAFKHGVGSTCSYRPQNIEAGPRETLRPLLATNIKGLSQRFLEFVLGDQRPLKRVRQHRRKRRFPRSRRAVDDHEPHTASMTVTSIFLPC